MEKISVNYEDYIKEYKNELINIDSLLSSENLIIDDAFTEKILIFFTKVNDLYNEILCFNIPYVRLAEVNKFRHKYLENIIKKIKSLKTNNADINLIISIIRWMPYKTRYISNVFTIFNLLKETNFQMSVYENLLFNIKERRTDFLGQNPYRIIELINLPRIIISSCLRYCLEIVIKSFVTNNENYLKNETNINTYSFEQLIKSLHNKRYDYRLKTVDISKSDVNNKCYFYYRTNFWQKKNLINNYNYLSDNTHYRPSKNPNLEIEKIQNIPEKNDIVRDFLKLKNIYSEFIESFKNHIIFFENEDYKLMIEINFDFYNKYNDEPIKIKKLDDCKVFALEE